MSFKRQLPCSLLQQRFHFNLLERQMTMKIAWEGAGEGLLLPLGPRPDGCNMRGWPADTPCRSSMCRAGLHPLEPCFAAFQDALYQGAGLEWEQLGWAPCPGIGQHWSLICFLETHKQQERSPSRKPVCVEILLRLRGQRCAAPPTGETVATLRPGARLAATVLALYIEPEHPAGACPEGRHR